MRYLPALLLLVCLGARAEWVKMGRIEKSSLIFLTSKTVFYIDPASITRNGNVAKVWEIHDLADKGSSGERSVLEAVEYDCGDMRLRSVSTVGKSRMARSSSSASSSASTSSSWPCWPTS